jgi:hypothetical protein
MLKLLPGWDRFLGNMNTVRMSIRLAGHPLCTLANTSGLFRGSTGQLSGIIEHVVAGARRRTAAIGDCPGRQAALETSTYRSKSRIDMHAI